MKKRLILIISLLPWLAFSQPMGPLSGSQPKSFSTGPDNMGFLTNSVSLFTGQVQFSMPLLSLQGRGKLSYGLTMSYNSVGIKKSVSAWNNEAPTGVLGLGWTLENSRIICDNKGTGTRQDDEFFILEGGVANQLIYSSFATGVVYYYTKGFTAWQISYNESSEKWTVVKEDGTKYIFGDNASNRNTIQYMVKWGNWIGESTLASGQQAQAYIWNLSEMTDMWGDNLTFQYLVTNEKVGGGNVDHTKASYLQQVQNLNGDRLVLSYQEKTNTAGGVLEFVDPHQESVEPDAYQEKYETKYLEKVGYYSGANELLSETRFAYGSVGTGETYKRQLTSVTPYNSMSIALPAYQFAYETATSTASNTGALVQVTSPAKGTTRYTYSLQNLGATSRELIIEPVSGYAEPQIFIGEDYVVVTRRQLNGSAHDSGARPVQVDVFTWENGRWNAALNVASLNSVVLADVNTALGVKRQDFSVVLGKDFFGILNKVGTTTNYELKLFIKKPDIPATWLKTEYQYVSAYDAANIHSDVNDLTLLAGDKFVLVGAKSSSFTHRVNYYIYTKTNTTWNEASYSSPTGEYYYSAANNYYITHKNADTDVITLFAMDQSKAWNSGTQLSSIITPNTTNGQKSYWSSTNAFALLMAYGTDEYLYWWDENYYTINKYQTGNLPNGFSDDSFVNFTHNSMATITSSPGCMAYRFTGSTWIPSGLLDYFGPSVYFRNLNSFGRDFVFRPRNVSGISKVTLNEFSPNSLQWSQVFDITASSDNAFALLAGNNYVTYSGKFYFRSKTGSWAIDPTTVPYTWLKSAGGSNDTFLQGGYDFVATSDPEYPVSGMAPIAISFKNNVVESSVATFPTDTYGAQRIWDRANILVATPQAAMNTLVTYYGGALQKMEDATRLKLYRKVQDSFSGSISQWVATRMEMGDGESTRYTNFVYEATTATSDATGVNPQFNKVTVISDDDINPATRPIGYIENYFHNGTVQSNFPTEAGGGSSTSYNLFVSLGYLVQIYNSSNSLVSYEITEWKKILKGEALMIRPIVNRALKDGIQRMTLSSYDEITTGNLKSKTIKTLSGATEISITTNTFINWNEVYDATRNVTTPIVFTKKTKNGIDIEASASIWKDWGAGSFLSLPSFQYAWKHQGPASFSYWSNPGSVPSSDWKLLSTVVAVDVSRGLVKEVLDNSLNINKSTIWHPTKPLVLAETSRAATNQVYFEGFEFATSNTSPDSRGGLLSSTAALTITLPSAGTYKLTYWKKISGGQWQLVEQIISSGVSIGGGGSFIDEVRLHPVNAQMISYSYDKLGNIISVCSPNNQFTYYEYDYNGFNGLKLVKDHNGNIVEYNTYNVKN